MSKAFTAAEVTAVMVVGVVGVLIPGLQPQLLGALAAEGTLTPAALGIVAAAELLAMGIAAGGAGFVLPITGLRATAAAALVAAGVLDIATGRVGAALILPVRALAGLAEGVLIWLAIGFIVRTAHPARWSGLYLMIQTLAQLALATAFGVVVIPRGGSAGGFAGLGIVTMLAIGTLAWLPRRYAALVHDHGSGGRMSTRGGVALAGVAAWLAFVVAVWVYLEPLASARGITPAALRLVVPISLGMQVIGAAVATLVADRLRAAPTIVAVAVVDLALLAVMAWAGGDWAFVVASATFGFLWLFVMPFQIPIVVAADPTRRAAALIGGAQLIGSSLGPVLAGVLIGAGDVRGVLAFGAVVLVLAAALTITAGRASSTT